MLGCKDLKISICWDNDWSFNRKSQLNEGKFRKHMEPQLSMKLCGGLKNIYFNILIFYTYTHSYMGLFVEKKCWWKLPQPGKTETYLSSPGKYKHQAYHSSPPSISLPISTQVQFVEEGHVWVRSCDIKPQIFWQFSLPQGTNENTKRNVLAAEAHLHLNPVGVHFQ